MPRRAAQRAGPELFDFQLGLGHIDLAFIEQLGNFALFGSELFGALVLERANRDHRQAWIDLHARFGISGIGAEESLLERRVGDAFAGAGKAGAKLHAAGAHFQIGGDHVAPADSPGDEHHVVGGEFGQEFLR